MLGKRCDTCAKCGTTSRQAPSLTFHRFPLPSKQHGSMRAKVWAMFSFPGEDWTSEKSLETLYTQHKMLCGNHFDNSAYTSSDRKRLNKFAIPFDAQNILQQLRNEQPTSSSEAQVVIQIQAPAAIQMEVEVQASTSQHSAFIEPYQRPDNIIPKKQKGILKDLDAKKIIELTPRKQKLYKRCRENLSEIMRLRKKLKKAKQRDRNILSDLSSSEAVNNMIKNKMGSSFYLLLQSQLKNIPRKLTGRRWTLDDKVLALSLYKKSSSCYRLLRRLFCLPSVSSLKILLNKIPMVCGINDQVINTIKEITDNRHVNDNLCILAFDEMSIRKHLSYNSKMDQLDGFQDHGSQGRSPVIATHALTFMAIGVRKSWKQPIAFYFSGDYVTADRLAVLIKEVLSACFTAGLQVVGTVCDLDGVNIRALNSLGSSTQQPYFDHMGHEIVTILDPPHLLKCFRNNFLKYDIQFVIDELDGKETRGIAKWNHIREFFTKDRFANFSYAPRLTEQHLQPNGKQKMKVKIAAQVLSHSVASGIFARVGINELPSEAVATGTVISFMDKLFDSLNGRRADLEKGKPFLTNMSSATPHKALFKTMKNFFSQMKFLGARAKPPSQEGWLRTLNGIERIFENLSRQFNIKRLAVRRLQQDPLENCFGCIRSNCGCNPNPTSDQFVAALKTSIVTNLINNNKNRNCLDDDNDILSNFKIFLSQASKYNATLTAENPAVPCHGVSETVIVSEIPEQMEIPECSGNMQACAYVCGFITKKMALKCKNCIKTMLAEPNTEVFHMFTSFKEYSDSGCSLNYVQRSFCSMVECAATIINNYLKELKHLSRLKENLQLEVNKSVNSDWLRGCQEHYDKNFQTIIKFTVDLCLKRFATKQNQEYSDEASKKSLKRKINILRNV